MDSIFNWRIENLERSYSNSNILSVDQQNHIIILPAGNNYYPSITGSKFHADNSFVRLVMGAIRSGKSTMSCAEVLFRACSMLPCKDGVRRVVCPIIRNTYPELKTTTIRTWENWWSGLGKVKTNFGSPISFFHQFNDGFGDIELLVWFLALDKPKDISKLLSLEATFAYVNELRELPATIFEHLRGRVGQYPSRNMMPTEHRNYWYGVFADTNPPDTDSWIYKMFEVEKPEGFKLFRQPAALLPNEDGIYVDNPLAENVQNLPYNYYKGLLPGSTEEYRKVYIFGEYGMTQDGKLVYSNYNDDVHANDKIEVSSGQLYLGWDFGLTPAALLCELVGNELHAIKEWVTERMYLDELLTVVAPFVQTNFKGRTIISVCDPAGSEVYLEMLKKAGIPTAKCDTNEIEPRISAVNYFLTKMTGGHGVFQLDKINCPALRKGFNSKYCYKRMQIIGEEKYRDVPDKTHPFSDIQDCLQYICRTITEQLNRNNQRSEPRKIQRLFKSEWL